MKQFRYKWKHSGEEVEGLYKYESQAVLREHLTKIGGELVEILEEKEIVEKKETVEEKAPPAPSQPAPSQPAPASKPVIHQPAALQTYNLLQNCSKIAEGDIVIKIWGWFQIVMALFAFALVLIFGIGTLLQGGEITWNNTVLSSVGQKLGTIVILSLVCAVSFFIGTAILTFPVIAARFLLFFATLGFLINGASLTVGGPIVSGIFWLAFNGFLVWHLIRKRQL